jgi:transcriptional regulator
MTESAGLLQGTLDLLILRTLALQPLHGVGVSDRIRQITSGVFEVKPGSLFPALHRLEEKGWITGEWSRAESGRRARFYELTATGRRQLARETRAWRTAAGAIENVLAAE